MIITSSARAIITTLQRVNEIAHHLVAFRAAKGKSQPFYCSRIDGDLFFPAWLCSKSTVLHETWSEEQNARRWCGAGGRACCFSDEQTPCLPDRDGCAKKCLPGKDGAAEQDPPPPLLASHPQQAPPSF